eukprot:CAMPEP_0180538218 /NCGR_PEP_ID=MMETSP1036_2-20121128/66234_1 /TAXON_ID=632150 /ORGANISM="Azadinium spinosum, Strain 3D9" /LENGTH=192 /DNA_ID=CAMNT_0022552869 /DNA_START=1 /DNA_END=577 /DNA_ORIENTATION=-
MAAYGYFCMYKPVGLVWDHVYVLGGLIAGKLMTLYSDFYYNTHKLLNNAYVTEHFLYYVGLVKDVRWEYLDYRYFPHRLGRYIDTIDGRDPPGLCLRYILTHACNDSRCTDGWGDGTTCHEQDVRMANCAMGWLPRHQVPGCLNFVGPDNKQLREFLEGRPIGRPANKQLREFLLADILLEKPDNKQLREVV